MSKVSHQSCLMQTKTMMTWNLHLLGWKWSKTQAITHVDRNVEEKWAS